MTTLTAHAAAPRCGERSGDILGWRRRPVCAAPWSRLLEDAT